MRFYPEPVPGSDSGYSTAVVLVNLGTPDAPTVGALRSYLREFLSDPRVVEIPRWLWWLLLRLVILPFRPAKSAAKYAAIWSDEGSPLKFHSAKQASLLRGYLGQRGHQVNVVYAMRYAHPAVPDVLAQLQADGYQRILILPAYPQYSSATTGSSFDAVFAHYTRVRNVPELRFVRHYPQQSAYIEALRQAIWKHWQQHGQADVLVLSFHGMPQRTRELGDPYYDECLATASALVAQLGLKDTQFRITFQSRFGRAAWLQPYTNGTVQALAKQGVRRVDVICPGFVADCLETLEEIGMEVKQEFLRAGGTKFHYIPALNESSAWINALADIAEQHLEGWPTRMAVMPSAEAGLHSGPSAASLE